MSDCDGHVRTGTIVMRSRRTRSASCFSGEHNRMKPLQREAIMQSRKKGGGFISIHCDGSGQGFWRLGWDCLQVGQDQFLPVWRFKVRSSADADHVLTAAIQTHQAESTHSGLGASNAKIGEFIRSSPEITPSMRSLNRTARLAGLLHPLMDHSLASTACAPET
jgi:hypothetical protein